MSIHPSALSRAVVLAASECRHEPPDAELVGRFVGGDEAAFGWIVRRHGAMVHGVCRRVLRGGHDAEDACQATFLVLARKAASIDGRTLAGWLHGVAYRVALRARAGAERRAKHEARVKVAAPLDPAREISLREAAAILDEELVALPEKYRAVLALCCLEGLTRDEAARRLGWLASLVKSRLEEARARLRDRLSRRGIDAPSVLALAALRDVTPAMSEVSGSAVALAEETLRAMAAPGLRAGVLGLAITTMLALGAVVMWPTRETAAPPVVPSAPRVDVHGDPLPPGAVARLGMVRFRHGGAVYSVDFSPDGKRVVSGGMDNTIRVWDHETGQELRRITGHGDRVRFVFFTADGRQVISASGYVHGGATDTSLRLWDLATGKEVQRYLVEEERRAFGQALVGVALSPDKSLLSAGYGSRLAFAEVATGKTVGVCEGPERAKLRSARFSPDGKKLAAVFESSVVLFDVATRRSLWRNTEPVIEAIVANELAFSPDGKTLAIAAGAEKPMSLIDVATGKVARLLDGKDHPIGPVTYTRDGKRIITGGWGATSVAWDVATGKPVADFGLLARSVDQQLSPDGKVLATASGQSVLFWDVATGRQLGGWLAPANAIETLSLSADDKVLVTSGRGDKPLVWNLATGRVTATLACREAPRAAALSADGKAVFVGAHWAAPVVADAATGKVRVVCEGAPRHVDSLACSPDGRLLVGTGWTDQTVYLWDARRGTKLPPLATLPANAGAKSMAISPDGRLVAIGGMDGVVRLWDVVARKELRQLVGQQGTVWGLAFSPDGRRVAAVTASKSKMFHAIGEDRTIRIWDVAGGHELQKLQGPPNGSWCVAWSPDGRVVATGGEDNLARVWELASGQERLRLPGHQGAVVSLAFTKDGRLISGSYDTTALVWDLGQAARPDAPPRDEEFPRLWEELRKDAAPAYKAIVAFQIAGDRAVRWLEKRLSPAAGPSAATLARLVGDLDSDEFTTREKACKDLEALGELAAPALEKALAGKPSLEVRRQAERLLKAARDTSPDRLREARAVEAIERIGTPAARRLLEKLAGGAAGARLTAEAKSALARMKPAAP